MIAWEWTLDKARDGDDEKTEKKTARKNLTDCTGKDSRNDIL